MSMEIRMADGPHSSADGDGSVRVLALLQSIQDRLDSITAQTSPGTPGAGNREAAAATELAARQASAELAGVTAWLRRTSPQTAVWSADAASLPRVSDDPSALATMLHEALDALDALGETLESDDPVAQFDAVQAVGLASAVLGAAHQRLLRAGLTQPRPAHLLAP